MQEPHVDREKARQQLAQYEEELERLRIKARREQDAACALTEGQVQRLQDIVEEGRHLLNARDGEPGKERWREGLRRVEAAWKMLRDAGEGRPREDAHERATT